MINAKNALKKSVEIYNAEALVNIQIMNYSNYEQSKFTFSEFPDTTGLKSVFPSISVTAKFTCLLDLFTSEIKPSIPLNNPSTITILSLTSN